MIDRFAHKNFLKAALLGSCFLFLSCENDQKVFDEWTKNKQMIEEGKNIETLISEGSHMKARLTAPQMIRYMSDTVYVEFPKTLKVDFYNITGAVESHLDSKYGKYFETMNRVLLRDSVVAYNFQGDTLHTQELWWDQNSQKIYTNKPVRIRKSGNLIFGIGMDANQDLSDITIRKVTGTLAVPDSVAAQR
jgi:LPS export ABC transporter protein LptC